MRIVREQDTAASCRYCASPVRSLGMCNHHYHKWNKYGDPLAARPRRCSPARDWVTNALEYEGDECLIWPFAKSKDGYGRFVLNGRMTFVARYICERHNGPPPSHKHQSAHTCGNGRLGCATKRHLVWKTPAENIADKWAHGTMRHGENHHRAKLTESDVREIRKSSAPRKELARAHGVGLATIDNVLTGRTWRHV